MSTLRFTDPGLGGSAFLGVEIGEVLTGLRSVRPVSFASRHLPSLYHGKPYTRMSARSQAGASDENGREPLVAPLRSHMLNEGSDTAPASGVNRKDASGGMSGSAARGFIAGSRGRMMERSDVISGAFLVNADSPSKGPHIGRSPRSPRVDLSPQRNAVSASSHMNVSALLTVDESVDVTFEEGIEALQIDSPREELKRLRKRREATRALRRSLGRSTTEIEDEKEEIVVDPTLDPETYLSTYNKWLRLGRLEQSIKLLEAMQGADMLDTDKIYHARFFDECKKYGAVYQAFRFFNLISSCRSPSLRTYSQLLSVCSHCSDSEGAFKVFQMAKNDGLEPDCVLYTGLISACCKANKLDVAFKIFYEMEAAGVAPNLHTFGVLIDGCAKRNQVAKAFGVYGIMLSKNLKPDRIIFNSLITACGRAGSLDRAFDVLSDMKAEELAANHITMGAVIDACTRSGQADKALEVYAAMRSKGVRATAEVFTAAVHACSKGAYLERAQSIFNDMVADGIKPDEILFSALIDVAAHANKPDFAFGLAQEMKQHRVNAGPVIYAGLMGLCCQLELKEEAQMLMLEMKERGVRATLSTFNAYISTLCKVGCLDDAMGAVEEMRTSGLKLDTTTYSALLAACDTLHRADVAFKLFRCAQVEGVRISLVMCESMIDICQHQMRTNAPPPQFSFLIPFYPSPHPLSPIYGEWASCALAVYHQFTACGFKPTLKLLSKVLCILRRPDAKGTSGSSDPDNIVYIHSSPPSSFPAPNATPFHPSSSTSYGAASSASVSSSTAPSQSSPFEVYDHHAFAIYDEAAALGAVPDTSTCSAPIVFRMESYPPHLAEMCILSLLHSMHTKRAGAPGAEMFPVTIHLPVEALTLKLKKRKKPFPLNIATRTGQAVSALLRRLDVAYAGYESSGTLRITSSALKKWIRVHAPPLPPTHSVGASPFFSSPLPQHAPLEDRLSHFGNGILRQQRAIRMGGRGGNQSHQVGYHHHHGNEAASRPLHVSTASSHVVIQQVDPKEEQTS